MRSRFIVLAAVLPSFFLGGCAVSPEEDPVQIRMNDLDQRLQRIERVMTNQSLLQMAQRIDALQADLSRMRGEVEMLQNQSEGGKTQTRSLYGDLEKRIAALETLGGVGGAAGGAGSVAPPPAASGGEQASYDAAFAALKGGDYPACHRGFQELRRDLSGKSAGEQCAVLAGRGLLREPRIPECHHRLPGRDHAVSGFAQGAGRHGEDRLHAGGAGTQWRCARHARGACCSVIPARKPRNSRPSA